MDKKRIKKQNLIIPLSAGILAIVILLTALIYPRLTSETPQYEKDSNFSSTVSTSQSTTEEKDESTTKSTTESSTESSTKKPVESTTERKNETTTKNSGKSFYSNVKYRSPTAKPADIYKHGKNLMLLNNDYELPEDYEWDLVDFETGKPVDALTLNDYEVTAVDRMTYQALKDFLAAAEKDGISIYIYSGYRTMGRQDRNFTRSVDNYISQGYSKEEAIKKTNRARAYPGTSEHNAGVGFDIIEKGNTYLSSAYEKTEEFKWLMANAEAYGFILRYPKDKTDITGIMYEPWHFRYVGVEHAKKINELGFCLEEYIEYLEA